MCLPPKIEDLSFRIDGRIERFHVTEGMTVAAGQILAELEKRDAVDGLNQARVERDQAERQLKRYEKLNEDGMIQTSQLEQAKDAFEQTTISFEQAELKLTRCSLKSPASGVILREYLDSRTQVTAGTPIYSFRDLSGSWLTEVELTDQNAFAFGLGTKAIARFAPYPGQSFDGSLTKQAGVADDNNGLYTVEVTIETQGRELRPGMVVEIDLSHESEQTFSMAPLDAMVDFRNNQGVIYLLDPTGEFVEQQTVHIVAITGGSVALVEPISAGRRVVIRGQQSLRDQTRVRVL